MPGFSGGGSTVQVKQYNLVADIGGTNARFALVDDVKLTPIEPRNLRCAEYPTLVDAVNHYLEQVALGRPSKAVMSIASPVTGDELSMTNHIWSFSVRETRAALGFRYLKVLNDYTALALALPSLGEDQCIKIGAGKTLAGHPKAVLGPGTGLGVSGVVFEGDHWIPLQSEGGHVSYGPVNTREQQIIEVIREKMCHVSAEVLLSGPGLSLIFEIITRLDDGEAKQLSPGEVTELALNDKSSMAAEALEIFCGILGTVAGNLALTLGARGGVYIGGGIVPKILDTFTNSGFRERFEQHGRLTNYLQKIPTYVINTDYPTLTGAAAALDKAYENIGVVSLDGMASR